MPETYQLMPTLLGTPVYCWLYKTGTAAIHYPNHPNITGDRFSFRIKKKDNFIKKVVIQNTINGLTLKIMITLIAKTTTCNTTSPTSQWIEIATSQWIVQLPCQWIVKATWQFLLDNSTTVPIVTLPTTMTSPIHGSVLTGLWFVRTLLLVLLTSVAILSLLLRAMTIAMLLCYMLHCHKCQWLH